MSRPTIRDIAQRSGVSTTAASFALNDRDGVSAATRERVKRAARDLGWSPSVAARALSGGAVGAIGVVFSRQDGSLWAERFHMQLIGGIEQVLAPLKMSLVIRLASCPKDEEDAYRVWAGERRVDGVLVIDSRIDDPRPALLAELRLPGVIVGSPGQGLLPGVVADDADCIRALVEHLAEQGYRSISHVGGSPGLLDTEARLEGLRQACADFDLKLAGLHSVDFTEASGFSATRCLIESGSLGEAVIYGSEILAFGGLGALQAADLRVPDDIGIASFEDSVLCRMNTPSVTALERDPALLGVDSARMLIDLISGRSSPIPEQPAVRVIGRESTRRQALGAVR